MISATAAACCLLLCAFPAVHAQSTSGTTHIVVVSDLHYGIQRLDFRGERDVPARVVNAALLAQLQSLQSATLPADGAVGAGTVVGAVSFLAITGDITNRAERGAPASSVSWEEFRGQFLTGRVFGQDSAAATPVYAIAGNHDVSNAIGYPVPLNPPRDATAMAALYNLAAAPSVPLTAETFDYGRHRVRYVRQLNGVHFAFLNIWPDSAERVWLADELRTVGAATPVVVFAHSQPSADYRHFSAPSGEGALKNFTQYQQLLSERFKSLDTAATREQRGLTAFLKAHRNVVAYVHGHSNYSEFYDYVGPDKDVSVPTFRVDSPMKGMLSGVDERELSFLVISIDHDRGLLTARECLWNTMPAALGGGLVWRDQRTVSLRK